MKLFYFIPKQPDFSIEINGIEIDCVADYKIIMPDYAKIGYIKLNHVNASIFDWDTETSTVYKIYETEFKQIETLLNEEYKEIMKRKIERNQ
jgi:hypothetical protein